MTAADLAVIEQGTADLHEFARCQIRDTLDTLTPDTLAGAMQLLLGLGYAEEDADLYAKEWADDQYDRLCGSEKEGAGWRWWADEPYGCRS